MNRHQFNQKQPITTTQHAIKRSRGDTLIEVLITFFIISVGILGASSMQITALQNLNGANYRDQAVIYTENLAEEIRAVAPNLPTDTVITGYNNAIGNNLPLGTLNIVRTTTVGTTITTITVPIGTTTGVAVAIPDNVVTLTVRWDEDRSNSTGVNCPVISSADLDCHQITFTP